MFFKAALENLAVNLAEKSIRKALRSQFDIDILDEDLTRKPNSQKSYMLYAHIPFCHTFCPYCSFHKYAYDEQKATKYFANLREEMIQIKDLGYDFSSMYVGGGTTLINEPELEKTLSLAKDLFHISEISCESDPNHIEPENLSRFSGLIDRLSVGVQSFDENILRKVARLEKFGGKNELLRKLKNAVNSLPALSLDLIFNFPFQTKEQLLSDINAALEVNSQQITFYPLMKSNLTREKIAASLGESSVDNEREFYEIICEKMNYWKPVNSWSFKNPNCNVALKDEYVGDNHEYLGVGSGSFSFLDGKLLINAFDLDDYAKRVENRRSAVIAKCEFDKVQKIRYLLLTEIFNGTIKISEFNAKNACNLRKDALLDILALQLCGAVQIKGDEIIPSEFGKYLFVVLMKEFYIGMDKVRAVFRADLQKQNSKLKIMDLA